MIIPDNQKIAIYWNGKPVGLVVGHLVKPPLFDGEISIVGWRGTMLGEEIARQSPNEVYKEARRIAKEKGLHGISMHEGSDVKVLYTPAFEE